MKTSFYSYFLVAAQFASLAGFVATGPVIAGHAIFLALELSGIALGVWAIAVMRIGKFNIVPDVRKDASLVTRGPYRLIRHPMYTSLLVATAALVADTFSVLRCGLWLALLVVLMAKLLYEERLLAESFSGYDAYRKRSHRLIPFIY